MRSAAAILALFTACGRFAFDPLPTGDAPVTGDASTPDASIDAPSYHATAVRFATASNDYLWTGSLANTPDSPRGTYSVWLHFQAGDGQQQLISVAQVVGYGGVLRQANDHIELVMQDCVGVPLLDMQSRATYTKTSGWIHVLASWDVSAGRAYLYINDADDRAANPTIVSGNICYGSLRWGIGGLASGALDADVAELYAALGTYVDLSNPANRARFASAGKPIDLGPACQGALATPATGCFVGDASNWAANKGNAGGFTVGGMPLAAAPTSPSD